MAAKTIRVLVVDDHSEWRRIICSTLEKQSHLCIVGVAEDGSEAIEKMEDLRPDLILLDVGLPKVNGLEVAGRASELSPRSKILMVSETRYADAAREAFLRGARGYVVKSLAATELLSAIETVLEGRQFISKGLVGNVFDDPPMNESSSSADKNDFTPSLSHRSRHEVEFYPDDAHYVSGLTHYVENRLKRQNPVILFATVTHQQAILQSLKAEGVDIDALIDRGNVVFLDSFEVLSGIMVDGKPDAAICKRSLGALVSSHATHPPVAFCGQCAPVLLSQGNVEGALQLEHMWDEITLAYGADTFCGYISNGLPDISRREIVEKICAEHSHVYGLESAF